MEGQRNSLLIYSDLPAGTVRVLDLLPGSGSDAIKAQLHTVVLKHMEPYKALSYTWGGTTAGFRTIQCNGYDLRVTMNLYDALIRFRDATKIRRMWIDAICINQSSEGERSQQVALMVNIYRNAEEVLIWLGNESPSSNIELTFRVATSRALYGLFKSYLDGKSHDHIKILSSDKYSMAIVKAVQRTFMYQTTAKRNETNSSRIQPLRKRMICIGDCNHQDTQSSNIESVTLLPRFRFANVRNLEIEDYADFEEYLKAAIKPPEYDLTDEEVASVFLSIYDLAERPYFTRAWIIQELLVASRATLVCGMHEVDFTYYWSVFGDRFAGIKSFTNSELKFRKPLFAHLVFSGLRNVNENIGERGYEIRELPFYRLQTVFDHRKELRSGDMATTTLAHLLLEYGEQACQDPRDHIFSLIGLIIEYSAVPEEVQWCRSILDYSLDFRQISILTAKHIVESYVFKSGKNHEHHHVHILYFDVHDPSQDNASLPTWVPCWSSKVRKSIRPPRFLKKELLCDLIPYNAKVVSKSLFMSAHLMDTVEVLSEVLDLHNRMYQEVEIYRTIDEERVSSPYGNFEETFVAFWRTIIADNPGIIESGSSFSTAELEALIEKWVSDCRLKYDKVCDAWGDQLKYREVLGQISDDIERAMGSAESAEELEDLSFDISTIEEKLTPEELEGLVSILLRDPEWDAQMQQSRSSLSKHCFMRTKRGFFGLAPPYIERGDVIALLSATNEVWCLRPRDKHYLLMGSVWVHGLMYKDDKYYQREWKDGDIGDIEIR